MNADPAARIKQAQAEYELELRLERLNAGIPDPITSMDEPGFDWEKALEIRAECQWAGELPRRGILP